MCGKCQMGGRVEECWDKKKQLEVVPSNSSIACGTSDEFNIYKLFEELTKQMLLTKGCSRQAFVIVQRIEGDMARFMNSALLNCYDIVHQHERQQAKRDSDC